MYARSRAPGSKGILSAFLEWLCVQKWWRGWRGRRARAGEIGGGSSGVGGGLEESRTGAAGTGKSGKKCTFCCAKFMSRRILIVLIRRLLTCPPPVSRRHRVGGGGRGGGGGGGRRGESGSVRARAYQRRVACYAAARRARNIVGLQRKSPYFTRDNPIHPTSPRPKTNHPVLEMPLFLWTRIPNDSLKTVNWLNLYSFTNYESHSPSASKVRLRNLILEIPLFSWTRILNDSVKTEDWLISIRSKS